MPFNFPNHLLVSIKLITAAFLHYKNLDAYLTYFKIHILDDGFRRLLRRASAEADRPLIREQRRNKGIEKTNLQHFSTTMNLY